jgi:hypothetical protein
MLKLLAKPILWLVTCAIPVFISACYGSPSGGPNNDSDNFEILSGTVKNASALGVSNIRVTCISGVGGALLDQTFTQVDGTYSIQSDLGNPCATLRFEDVDAAENGTYVSQDVTVGDAAVVDVVLQEPTV